MSRSLPPTGLPARAGAILATLFALSACAGSTASPAASGPGPAGSEEPSTEQIRVGLVLPDLTNALINDIYLGAQEAAEQAGNIEIIEGGSSLSQEWLNACEGILAAGVQYVGYDSLDAAGHDSCIRRANEEGVPAFCIFACVTTGENAAELNLDWFHEGEIIGTWMGEQLAGEAAAEVGLLQGPVGDEASAAIAEGFRAALTAACPNCVIVGDVTAGFDRDSGHATATNMLTANPNIVAMYGAFDEIALGAQRAVEEEGRSDILVAGHNGNCGAVESILLGGLDFTVLVAGQPFGHALIDLVQQMEAGETPTVGDFSEAVVPLDKADAEAYLDGTKPDPPAVDMQARMQAAQEGCD